MMRLDSSFVAKIIFKAAALNLIFLAVMSLFRAVFFLYFGSGLDFTGFKLSILKAFYMGVRYDAAVLSYISMPVAALIIFLIFVNMLDVFLLAVRLIKYYYAVMIGSLYILMSIDFGFYSYFQNHLNLLIYGFFEDDTAALMSTISENYNLFFVIIGFIFVYVAVFWLSKKVLYIQPKRFLRRSLTSAAQIVVSLVLIAVSVMTARGSFGTFPLGIDNAEVSGSAFINKVAINCVYTLQAAIEARGKENRGIDYIALAGYKNNIRQAFAEYLNVDVNSVSEEKPESSLTKITPENENIKHARPNVIFIMMESLGTDLIKYSSPEFNVMGELQTHFLADTVFYNFLPAHEGTIGSLETAIVNIAKRPNSKNLSQSQFGYNKFTAAAPRVYKNAGYKTYFIYGGNTGWRNVGSFMPNLGFDAVIGEGAMSAQYPRSQWGVYDEYLFDHVFKTLEANPRERKFIYALSTTNHPPYSLDKGYKPLPLNIPEDLKKRIIGEDLAKKRFETYQYSNEMLGRLITKIKNSKHANNTIIVVTGDHNFWNVFAYSQTNLLDSLAVPFYVYVPQALKFDFTGVDTNNFGSHIDIMPTLYNISLSGAAYAAMGTDMLRSGFSDNIAFTDSGVIMDKSAAVEFDLFNKASTRFFNWNAHPPRTLAATKQTHEHAKLIKHYKAAVAIAEYLLQTDKAGK
jgi:phosphoglycerol transferase MdoB-like AlkP superfamily enzyme